MLITPEYKKQNALFHIKSPAFGSNGRKRVKHVESFLSDFECNSILDYGCGKGNLCKEMSERGIQTENYDPGIPEFDIDPSPADLVVFFEGPEHVEESCVDDVLDHVASLTNKVAWIVTALRGSAEILPDGRNAHVTIRNHEFWLEKFRARFPRVEVRVLNENDILDVLCFTR